MDTPWWYLLGGVLVAIVGAAMVQYAEDPFFQLVGILAIGLGWVAAQFAIIAAGVEYALRRVREDVETE